ncbi:MAG: adenylosuccinate synthase [Bacteroidales bacterium]|nr:adenylosuccinate synthase [Bacteroidales bacterium]
MNKVDVVLGLQWGDEGKGKIVDVLAEKYDNVARFQGGPNAGHSLHFNGKSYVLRSIPSGIFREGTVNIIGNGVVFDPIAFVKECGELKAAGVPVEERLVIGRKANIILPTHRLLDAANEAAAGKGKIGSTQKGIGPCYTDKVSRHGLRVGDMQASDFMDKYLKLKARHIAELEHLGYDWKASVAAPLDGSLEEEEKRFFAAVEKVLEFPLVNCEYFLNEALRKGSVLAEGAQGTMLDIDYGSYPFVTSSTTSCSGACLGLGVAPQGIGRVFGIFKAYCTRVGSGPFPTELFDATGDKLREVGHEFGAVTGRPRRCGWLDLVALRYAVIIDGVTDLIMMKADCLDSFDTVKVCTSYRVNGKETLELPFDISQPVEPVYTGFKGWKRDLSAIRSEEALPAEFREYIAFMEKYLGVPVKIISLGPDREATIFR